MGVSNVLWIQVILVTAVILIGLFLTRPSGRDSHLALRRLFLAAFVLVAILSILFPQWLSLVARFLGVGRGTDLLLYGLVLAFLIYVSTAYRRNVQLDRKLTRLAREITLAEARTEDLAGDIADEHRTNS
ncbi:DUF2304 domain-containing protein [Cryobacterium tagatosivorans]|uniref:DUF2304 domain-containing protein n=1 Tax=Cryobacterium tagatosivorans TaxID=1259199 RepID=A0A4R8UHK4_9MICO|nr:DUF2304 domain-containing protein [Cryobacterium tagatosivorans]TFB53941.1 DUF2304 domain-containing protein [Cryobacterium tagatosivorans]